MNDGSGLLLLPENIEVCSMPASTQASAHGSEEWKLLKPSARAKVVGLKASEGNLEFWGHIQGHSGTPFPYSLLLSTSP